MIAEQHVRDGGAAGGAGEPGLQYRGDLAEPRHQHRAAAFDDHDRAGIGRRDRLDQRILVDASNFFGRQRQAGRVVALAHRLINENDGHVGRRLGAPAHTS